ncbi:nicotinamide riboside transporter PnuC [Aquimarina brevivitae]|uniref:Nicotinamide riboside transporter PnuC n=1 Tax=Aquimarina brevivitae TaxID=323412 RepID=A0A4Q7PGF8_9FLAO|nr:nicotinamide riboside transporter PnuC [Aquimarina brevivitae]RZS99594.1 nicotinamide mononucleotide transporter [Aquimarina brevivitae]
MNHIFDFLFGQYENYANLDIVLEITAVLFGLSSVLFAWRNKIWVYPTGIISTAIYVYLLYKWDLLGDMIINGYYFMMSVYGWYVWTRKVGPDNKSTPISKTNLRDKKISLLIFWSSILLIYLVYVANDKWDNSYAYIDTLTTAIFFVGMWLMARRKIENWIFWILGDLISVPLYFYKGFTFTSIQYLIFTVIAIFGYLEWKKRLNKPIVTA